MQTARARSEAIALRVDIMQLQHDAAAGAYKVRFDSSDTLRKWNQSEIANDTDGSNTERAAATR
jgi:hypothetical protein